MPTFIDGYDDLEPDDDSDYADQLDNPPQLEQQPGRYRYDADQVVQELTQETPEDEFSEVDTCLAKAAYYREIARTGVVQDDGTRECSEVNQEARQWARTRAKALLGRQEPAEEKQLPLFTPDEVQVLKNLVVSAMRMSTAPKPKPVTVQQPPPQVLQRKTPATSLVRPSLPKTPSPKVQQPPQRPVARQEAPKPKAPPARPQAATPQQRPKGKRSPLQKLNDRAEGPAPQVALDYDKIPSKEPFKDTNGKMYVFRDNPNYDPDDPNSKIRFKVDVTNKTGIAGSRVKPFPSIGEVEAMSAMQSENTVRAGASASGFVRDEGIARDGSADLAARLAPR